MRKRRKAAIPMLPPRLEVQSRKDQLGYVEWCKNKLLRHLPHSQEEEPEVAKPEAALRILLAR